MEEQFYKSKRYLTVHAGLLLLVSFVGVSSNNDGVSLFGISLGNIEQLGHVITAVCIFYSIQFLLQRSAQSHEYRSSWQMIANDIIVIIVVIFAIAMHTVKSIFDGLNLFYASLILYQYSLLQHRYFTRYFQLIRNYLSKGWLKISRRM